VTEKNIYKEQHVDFVITNIDQLTYWSEQIKTQKKQKFFDRQKREWGVYRELRYFSM